MSLLKILAIDEICQRGSVREVDVAMLRRTFSREAQLGPSAIEALFRIKNLARIQDGSWPDFFVETLTDYVVRELEPSGYVTAAHAGWLIARVSTAGHVRTKTEHDLLRNIVDKARWVPESLLVYALNEIKVAVSDGVGPLRMGGVLPPGTLTLHEIEQIRQLLFAYGADGPMSITQAEIDVLLDIDAAIGPEAEHIFRAELEAWTDLVRKATANAILSASGHVASSREEALRERAPMLRTPAEPDNRLALVPRQDGVLACYRQLSSEQRAMARLERQRIEIITGEPAPEVDAVKLADRLLAQPENGRAVGALAMLRNAGFALHPVFQPAGRMAVCAA